jgi:hypothetical protein
MSTIVKGPNPLLRIGHNVIVIAKRRSRPQNISKRPQNIIKVVITTQEKKSTLLFAPNSSLGEQIKSAYMPSWALLGMTSVKGKVRKRNYKVINKI